MAGRAGAPLASCGWAAYGVGAWQPWPRPLSMKSAAALGRAPGATLVAQYVRMSTDQQQYSIANQCACLAAYAASHGMHIVESYRDDGRSGLDLGGRPGLQRLLDEVRRSPRFEAVLVFDVSRWGRFQNADESAFYEYLCLTHGVRVIYVAEPFGDGQSPMAVLLKGLKRSMAAEYSRELSTKVSAGQRRLTSMGYRMGGAPGYGLRRMVVDAKGEHRGVLQPGERKSYPTDRVTLVPGPADEVATVRWIFEQSAAGVPTDHITRRLNLVSTQRRWTKTAVRSMLCNDKYMGVNTYGRLTQVLKHRLSSQPEDTWTRSPGAFEPIVSPALFLKAKAVREKRCAAVSDRDALAALRRLLREHGQLTCALIARSPSVPSPQLYMRRFGSLRRAYELIGYVPARDISFGEKKERIAVWRDSVTAFAVDLLTDAGSAVRRSGWTMTVDDAWSVAFHLLQASKDHRRWKWRVPSVSRPADLIIFIRMAPDASAPLDYLVLPSSASPAWPALITEQPDVSARFFMFPSLAILLDLAAVSRG